MENELDFMAGVIDDYNDIAVKKIIRKKESNKNKTNSVDSIDSIDSADVKKYRKKLFDNSSVNISLKNYTYLPWNKFFENLDVKLLGLITNFEWYEFFVRASKSDYFFNIQKVISEDVADGKVIYPYPELLFNTFNMLSPQKIKVVIIGQDPYHNSIEINKKFVPQAMGLSFSVPDGVPIPPSLHNIIKNLDKYGHISKKASDISSGNLIEWVTQGVFLLNTALTVVASKPKSYSRLWNSFTIDLIDYLSTNYENIIFVGWGTDAYDIIKRIDCNKHKYVITSHPSPYSADATFKRMSLIDNRKEITYPSFNSCDIFGKINEHMLDMHGYKICWDLK